MNLTHNSVIELKLNCIIHDKETIKRATDTVALFYHLSQIDSVCFIYILERISIALAGTIVVKCSS